MMNRTAYRPSMFRKTSKFTVRKNRAFTPNFGAGGGLFGGTVAAMIVP